MWLEKFFFLFADTSTANIPWSKSLHKFNHHSQMDFNSEWITWSKLWRCQHSLIASFSHRDSKIQFLRVHGSPFVVGRLQFSLQKERKEENVCTDLKSSFLYLSRSQRWVKSGQTISLSTSFKAPSSSLLANQTMNGRTQKSLSCFLAKAIEKLLLCNFKFLFNSHWTSQQVCHNCKPVSRASVHENFVRFEVLRFCVMVLLGFSLCFIVNYCVEELQLREHFVIKIKILSIHKICHFHKMHCHKERKRTNLHSETAR